VEPGDEHAVFGGQEVVVVEDIGKSADEQSGDHVAGRLAAQRDPGQPADPAVAAIGAEVQTPLQWHSRCDTTAQITPVLRASADERRDSRYRA
jgi:hypothetical protein